MDPHYDDNLLYKFTSEYPELERRYYHESLKQRFPEEHKEVARDVERRHLLRSVSSLTYMYPTVYMYLLICIYSKKAALVYSSCTEWPSIWIL